MAVEVLLQAIASEGDAEARKLVDAARAQADEVRAAADARARRQCEEALVSRTAGIRVEFDTRRAGAVREARVRVLMARDQFLGRIFAAVEQALPGVLDAPSSAEVLHRLYREAMACFPDAAVRVRCRHGLATVLRSDGDSSGRIEVAADDAIPEGMVLESLDGSLRVDNTLVARLRRLRPALSIVLIDAASSREPA